MNDGIRNEPGVYILEFPTGLYVGSSKHIRRRVLRHIADFKRGEHSNKFLQRVFEKHGEPIVHVFVYCDEVDVLKREKFAIDMFKPRFNLAPTAGRNTGHKHSIETREQMRQASIEAWKKRDRRISDEHRRLLSLAGKGKRHTEEAKLKISRSKMGIKRPEGFGEKIRMTKMLKKFGIPKMGN